MRTGLCVGRRLHGVKDEGVLYAVSQSMPLFADVLAERRREARFAKQGVGLRSSDPLAPRPPAPGRGGRGGGPGGGRGGRGGARHGGPGRGRGHGGGEIEPVAPLAAAEGGPLPLEREPPILEGDIDVVEGPAELGELRRDLDEDDFGELAANMDGDEEAHGVRRWQILFKPQHVFRSIPQGSRLCSYICLFAGLYVCLFGYIFVRLDVCILCLYNCVCVSGSVFLSVYACPTTYIHKYIHRYQHSITHIIRTSMPYIHAFIGTIHHGYIHRYQHPMTHIHTYVHTCIRTYTHTHRHTYIHTYILCMT